ncbi:Vitelline envelope sperm lysin receptor [Frankliniella fusca]|uniref:Vitelline envelope sperm lysin receptor n=1 Tax=Frankliniella fusca TaxID=407009 RepID=A0AAE1LM25_9NEOP|nr:Vitelline envelope sperm lysin receptor [Frankliniella fusca]
MAPRDECQQCRTSYNVHHIGLWRQLFTLARAAQISAQMLRGGGSVAKKLCLRRPEEKRGWCRRCGGAECSGVRPQLSTSSARAQHELSTSSARAAQLDMDQPGRYAPRIMTGRTGTRLPSSRGGPRGGGAGAASAGPSGSGLASRFSSATKKFQSVAKAIAVTTKKEGRQDGDRESSGEDDTPPHTWEALRSRGGVEGWGAVPRGGGCASGDASSPARRPGQLCSTSEDTQGVAVAMARGGCTRPELGVIEWRRGSPNPNRGRCVARSPGPRPEPAPHWDFPRRRGRLAPVPEPAAPRPGARPGARPAPAPQPSPAQRHRSVTAVGTAVPPRSLLPRRASRTTMTSDTDDAGSDSDSELLLHDAGRVSPASLRRRLSGRRPSTAAPAPRTAALLAARPRHQCSVCAVSPAASPLIPKRGQSLETACGAQGGAQDGGLPRQTSFPPYLRRRGWDRAHRGPGVGGGRLEFSHPPSSSAGYGVLRPSPRLPATTTTTTMASTPPPPRPTAPAGELAAGGEDSLSRDKRFKFVAARSRTVSSVLLALKSNSNFQSQTGEARASAPANSFLLFFIIFYYFVRWNEVW